MKVLVIGGGGREHAIIWKLAQSKNVSKIYCAPGNGGIADLAECVPIDVMDFEKLTKFAKENNIETKTGTIYSSDVFYNQIKNEEYKKYNCIGVEMESFALFANSKLLSKNAACILTVSNIINNEKSELSAEERERSLNKMIKLALESSRHME